MWSIIEGEKVKINFYLIFKVNERKFNNKHILLPNTFSGTKYAR
jgi:hypothetical protein